MKILERIFVATLLIIILSYAINAILIDWQVPTLSTYLKPSYIEANGTDLIKNLPKNLGNFWYFFRTLPT